MDDNNIELSDYLRIVWKWKWFIIIFTIACAIVAGLISYSMSDIYEVATVIEPGVIDIDSKGKVDNVESVSSIKSRIDSKVYNYRVLRRLGADPKEKNIAFKTNQPKGSNILQVKLEVKNIDEGVQALSALFHEIADDSQHHIDSKKLEVDQEINLHERQLDNHLREKNELEKEITLTKANTDRIREERNTLIAKEANKSDKLSLLVYTNLIQQNMAHNNKLNKQKADLMSNVEWLKSKIDVLQVKKQTIKNVKLIKPPQPSLYPIKPKKKLNVILASIIGFFITLFLAFFIEYLQKMRNQPESSTASE